MILHRDGLIELDYEVKTDILKVRWPDINHTTLPVLQYSFTKLIDTISHYHITRLLIDSQGSKGEYVGEDYKAAVLQLTKQLAATRLQKIARVVSNDANREARTQAYTKEFKAQVIMSLQNKDFNDEASARAWLSGTEEPNT